MEESLEISNEVTTHVAIWCTMAIADCSREISPRQIKSHIVNILDTLLAVVDHDEPSSEPSKQLATTLTVQLQSVVPPNIQNQLQDVMASCIPYIVFPTNHHGLVHTLEISERRQLRRHHDKSASRAPTLDLLSKDTPKSSAGRKKSPHVRRYRESVEKAIAAVADGTSSATRPPLSVDDPSSNHLADQASRVTVLSYSPRRDRSTHALMPQQMSSDGSRITRSSTKGSSITESTAATEPLKMPSPTAAEFNNTPSSTQLSLLMDVEPALSPTTGVTSNSDEKDQASRVPTHSTKTPPPRTAIQTADPSTAIALSDNPNSEQTPELIEPERQWRTTRSSTRSNPLPPTATQPEDLQLASAIPQSKKRKRTEDDNYNNESSDCSVPPPEKKTTRKPKAPEEKAENWEEVGLIRYPQFHDNDTELSLMQNRQCHYNLDIRTQISNMFLEERGYRGINTALTMDSIEHSSTVDPLVNPEQDMTSVVRLFPECVKHSVSTFCAIIKDALRTPSTCSRDNVSLARQWNISLEAEKDSAKKKMRWRVEQILLGKKC